MSGFYYLKKLAEPLEEQVKELLFEACCQMFAEDLDELPVHVPGFYADLQTAYCEVEVEGIIGFKYVADIVMADRVLLVEFAIAKTDLKAHLDGLGFFAGLKPGLAN